MKDVDPWDAVGDCIAAAEGNLEKAGEQPEPDPSYPFELWAMNDLADAVRHMYEILRPVI